MNNDNNNRNDKILNSKFVFIVLFILGFAGSIITLLFHRDTTAAIMLGYGFSLVELRKKIEDGSMKYKKIHILLFCIAADCLSIPSIVYSTAKFPTIFNKVICVLFIIFQSWNTYMVIKAAKSKNAAK